MMHKRFGFIALILIMAISFSGFQQEASANEKPPQFYDLKAVDWAWDSIYYLTGQGVINGDGAGNFMPAGNLTRGAAAAILVRELYPNANAPANSPFPDVKPGHMFYDEILVAAENNLFEGVADGKFKPDSPIDRASVAKILAIAYDLQLGNKSVQFKDVSSNHWAKEFIPLLSSNEIIKGYPGGTFDPGKNVRRDEFAKMLAETLVHKDPSIWFTPVPGSANGYMPNKNKSYTFSGEGSDPGYTLRYKELNEKNQPEWIQHNTDGTTAEVTYDEDTQMAASFTFSDHDGHSFGFDPYLLYPLFIGKTWDPFYEIFGVFDEPQVLTTITSTNATIVTPAGTFNDVIEVSINNDITYYVAKGIGMIMAKEGNEKLFELTKIE